MATTNTNKPNPNEHEPITMDNVYTVAKKAAYHTLKLLESKSANETIRNLINGFAHLDTETAGTNDLINTAVVALLENMDDPNAFPLACKAVRQYVYNQSTKRADTKHLYIDDPNTGDIVNVNNDINHLINRLDNQSIISDITAQLSPTQRKVLKYIAYGYTNVTIAKRLNISDKTVSVHISRIRAKASELYPNFTI